jgi:hypothetical protein
LIRFEVELPSLSVLMDPTNGIQAALDAALPPPPPDDGHTVPFGADASDALAGKAGSGSEPPAAPPSPPPPQVCVLEEVSLAAEEDKANSTDNGGGPGAGTRGDEDGQQQCAQQ